jgi:Uma2 family endonuclease
MSISTPALSGTTFDPLYPDSDGQLMGESGFHVSALICLHTVLENFFRSRNDVFVGADMFVYYERGNPQACRAPDVFVAVGVTGNHQRRSYRLWEELVPPTVVIEVTSEATFSEDDKVKPLIYAKLGVAEYYLFDPDGIELDPPVKGFRLRDGCYEPMLPDAHGRLESRELGLLFEVDGPLLRAVDPRTGRRLMTLEEMAEEAQRQADADRRRIAALEAELARLKREKE